MMTSTTQWRIRTGIIALAVFCNSFQGIAQEAGAQSARRIVPRVLLVRGLWHEQYRWEEALARAGVGSFDDCWAYNGMAYGWLGWGSQGEGGVRALPAPAALARYDAVIVMNVNAQALGAHQQALTDYVLNGGTLIVMGGRFALGRQYRESTLAAVCPVEFPGVGQWNSDLVTVPAGLAVGPGPDAVDGGFGDLAWDRQPRVFWYHDVRPRPGAKVLLVAGDRNPLLIVGESGKGRVAVFAGSVMGDPPPGHVPFWEWPGWPVVQARLLQWLTANVATERSALSVAIRQRLAAAAVEFDDLLDEKPAAAAEDFDAVVQQAAAECRSAEALEVIVEAVRQRQSDIAAATVEAVAAAWPLADARFAGLAEGLVESGLPYKTALGARLLGASKAPAAAARLAQLAESGRPRALTRDEWRGVGGPGSADVVLPQEAARRKTAIQLGALAGLGHLGAPECLPALRQAAATHAADAPRPTDFIDELTDANRLYQQAWLAVLACGDDTAADPVVDFLLENIYTLARTRTEGGMFKEQRMKKHDLVLPLLLWRQTLYDQLPHLPDSVLPALARRIAQETDRRVIEFALPMFAGRRVAAEVVARLQKSPIPAVAAIGATPDKLSHRTLTDSQKE